MEINEIKSLRQIEHIIYTIRGVQVMFDQDLAILYDDENRRLNEQVKRNKDRFPNHFMFVITDEEWQNLMSQNATSSLHGGRRKNLAVFTEQGVAMFPCIFLISSNFSKNVQKNVRNCVLLKKIYASCFHYPVEK